MTNKRIESLDDLPNIFDVKLDYPLRWGDWILNTSNHTLTHEPHQYEIDLDVLTTSAEVLDYIVQISNKLWSTEADTANLVAALTGVLDPQKNLCSWGHNKRLTFFQVQKLVDDYADAAEGT